MSCWSNIEGTWSYNDLIGSKFKVKSMRLSYFGAVNTSADFKHSGEEYTLKAVYFRASTDGKVIPLFRMEEVCGKLFLPKDLELVEILPVSNISTVCGKFSPCSKNLIGINEETEDGEVEPQTVNEEEPQQSSTYAVRRSVVVNSEESHEKEMIEDPFLQNINSWKIVKL